MRVTAGNSSRAIGFQNEGYWGIDVKQQRYTGSFWTKGSYFGQFTASLRSNLTNSTTTFGSVQVPSNSTSNDWVEHKFELTPTTDAPNTNNTFAVTFDPAGLGDGYLDFHLISLFPPTYKNRTNGLRIDIAEALDGMNPKFIRFPGGNMLEGLDNGSYWDWKDTLGPLRELPGFEGDWDYQQTHGLGLMEYLYWAEDMGLHIVLGVWAGLALDGNYTQRADLQPYIDDALNEVEFVCGPAKSTWDARRAELGHPKPFELNNVEIGNEDWLAGGEEGWESYEAYRFPFFYDAISTAYPNIQIISSAATSDPLNVNIVSGPNEEGGIRLPPGVLGDHHPYREPDELVGEFSWFDNDIGHIVGEVAATHVNGAAEPRWGESEIRHYPWWQSAIGKAISLIGYERNFDRVPATFHAPVLKNENRYQWSITLLQFDAGSVTKAVTWYCWSLFAYHPITHTLPTNSSSQYGPLFWGAGRDEPCGNALVWKAAVYNTSYSMEIPVTVAFDGVSPGTQANLTVLTNTGMDGYAYNDPSTGVNVVNTTSTLLTADQEGVFVFSLPGLSVAVLDTDLGDSGNTSTLYKRS